MKPALVVVVLVGVLLVVWLLTSSLDTVVKRGIESYGSELAGVAVRVEQVQIMLTRGRGRLRGLSLGNPPGFEARDALHFDEISFEIETSSLMRSPVVISEVLLDAPKVVYEFDAAGRSNFDVIRAHMSGNATRSEPAEPDARPLRILIRRLRSEAGVMEIAARSQTGSQIEVKLPSIELLDLGAPNGATPQEIGARLLSAVVGGVIQRAARSAAGRIVEEGTGAVKGFLDRLRR